MTRRARPGPVRDLWTHESSLIEWLGHNPSALSAAIGVALSDVRRERAVGDLRVDLVAQCAPRRSVVIECQFGYSDHDHLGKLITYLATADASKAVWVTEHVCPEHVQAVRLLNALPQVAFYLVQVAVIPMGARKLEPMLRLIAGPQGEVGEIVDSGSTRREDRDRHNLKRLFWAGLLRSAAVGTPLFARKAPGTGCECAVPAGIRGVQWVYQLDRLEAGAWLRVSRSRTPEKQQSALLSLLRRHKGAITAVSGHALSERRGRNGNTLVGIGIAMGGYRSPQKEWPAIQRAMVGAMGKLTAAIDPYLLRIPR